MRPIARAIVLGLVTLPTFAQAPPPAPNPAAASQAQALLALFNKNDEAALRNFFAANIDPTSSEAVETEEILRTLGALYRQTQGIDVDATFPAGPHGVMVRFHGRQGPGIGALFLGVAPGEKHTINRLDVMPFEMLPPPPSAAPRPFPEVKEGASESNRLKALGDSLSTAAKAGRFSGVVLITRRGQTLLEKVAGQADKDSRCRTASIRSSISVR